MEHGGNISRLEDEGMKANSPEDKNGRKETIQAPEASRTPVLQTYKTNVAQ